MANDEFDHDYCENHEDGNHRFDMLRYADDHPEEMRELQAFVPLTPANPAAPKPKCRRHEWVRNDQWDGGPTPTTITQCVRCNAIKNPALSKQNKNNKDRGLAIQRRVLALMGLDSIPGNGPTDGRSRGENPLFLAEVKSGMRFNGVDYADMAKLPAQAGQVRLLVKVETPGTGHKARATVTMPLEDWLSLHGPTR